ncbi:MAG: hypothetical protein JO362_08285 [Streptomycetaceae bacterium]|nr:hypothetical protein [Streptomycetaceae bacterium]
MDNFDVSLEHRRLQQHSGRPPGHAHELARAFDETAGPVLFLASPDALYKICAALQVRC